jgi:release factor glutamine methyltransferase
MLEAAAVAAGRDPLFLNRPELTQRVAAVFRSHVARRSKGEPLAYVLGEASFRGIDIIVTPDVLIPRPETEELVDLALEKIPRDAVCRILEQGTGSGAIAVAIAIERPLATVVAIDNSPAACEIAKRNAARHGVAKRVRVEEGDLWPSRAAAETEPGFDLLVANLPYVAEGAWVAADVDEWEPKSALYGGKTGREVIERSVAEAENYLTPEAGLIYEIGEEQEPGFRERFGDRFVFRTDLTGRTRFMIGRA